MNEMNEQQKQWARIVAKAWADDDFKQRLLTDPAAVLTDEGASFPAGATVRVVESQENEAIFVLPTRPADMGLPDELDERLAAHWPYIYVI
ncbi:NHLP leader peptide family RiPP precursor [Desulfovibrio inopinatus]|uniref:NHLP leader peptide family RiPP precursor n=1 Tax=Desulfovibrio inopinatus TaxID=102109 RepID=UPI0004256B60|nr:NHLP leader peptide family RiPP precursor [Desulfovibrio inopinatus]